MARRANRTVNYANGVTRSRRTDGRWRVRWYQPGSTEHDERRERSFAVTDDAEARAFAERLSAELGAEHRTLSKVPGEEVTWAQVCDAWLTVKQVDWHLDMAVQNRQLLARWARPVLAEVPVTQLREEHYQLVFAKPTEKGRPGSRARVRSLLAQVERWASENEYRSAAFSEEPLCRPPWRC